MFLFHVWTIFVFFHKAFMLSNFESPKSQFFLPVWCGHKLGGGAPSSLYPPQPASFVAAGGWTTSPQVPQERPGPRCALTRPGTSTAVASGLCHSNLFNCNDSNILKAMFPLRCQNTLMFLFSSFSPFILPVDRFWDLGTRSALSLFFCAPLLVHFFWMISLISVHGTHILSLYCTSNPIAFLFAQFSYRPVS